MTSLQLPMTDILLRTIKSGYADPLVSPTGQLTRYAVGGSTLMCTIILTLYLIRVFGLNQPSELVPWCSPISKIAYVNLTTKLLIVCVNVFDHTGAQILIEILLLFCLMTFQAVYRLLFKP